MKHADKSKIDYSSLEKEELVELRRKVKAAWASYEFSVSPKFMCLHLDGEAKETVSSILSCIFIDVDFTALRSALGEFLELNEKIIWDTRINEGLAYNYWLYFKVTGKLMAGRRILLEAEKLEEKRKIENEY